MSNTTETIDLKNALLRKVDESATTSRAFFETNAEQITTLAQRMAERFQAGGRLLVMGNGGSACDAEHIVVEFMHPIFEKRKALPALSLVSQSALLTALSNDKHFSKIFAEQIKTIAAPNDIALAISTSGMSANLVAGIVEARKLGALTAAFTGKDGGRLQDAAEFNLCVTSYSIHRIQEAHTILLHTLWDLIHIFMGEDDVI